MTRSDHLSPSFCAIMAFSLFAFGCIGIPGGGGGDDDKTVTIRTFTDCEAAGYPVMESYPSQCRTPDGRTFVSDKDAFEAWLDRSCVSDGDCALADRSLGFSCCYAGACREVDRSKEEWIAVNAEWFKVGREGVCPPESACGPSPLCPERVVEDGFDASCIAGVCQKTGPVDAWSQDTIPDVENQGSADGAGGEVTDGPEESSASQETVEEEGLLFGGGRFILLLDDAIASGCADGSGGAFSIRYAYLDDILARGTACEGGSFLWTSPGGDVFRIRAEEIGAGYSGESFAEVSVIGEASSDIRSICCEECGGAFSQSPVSVSPDAQLCGPFTSADPIGDECLNYFERFPQTVLSCS